MEERREPRFFIVLVSTNPSKYIYTVFDEYGISQTFESYAFAMGVYQGTRSKAGYHLDQEAYKQWFESLNDDMSQSKQTTKAESDPSFSIDIYED